MSFSFISSFGQRVLSLNGGGSLQGECCSGCRQLNTHCHPRRPPAKICTSLVCIVIKVEVEKQSFLNIRLQELDCFKVYFKNSKKLSNFYSKPFLRFYEFYTTIKRALKASFLQLLLLFFFKFFTVQGLRICFSLPIFVSQRVFSRMFL